MPYSQEVSLCQLNVRFDEVVKEFRVVLQYQFV